LDLNEPPALAFFVSSGAILGAGGYCSTLQVPAAALPYYLVVATRTATPGAPIIDVIGQGGVATDSTACVAPASAYIIPMVDYYP